MTRHANDIETNSVQFTMRMNKKIYSELKQSACKNKRSICKELEYIAEQNLMKECK